MLIHICIMDSVKLINNYELKFDNFLPVLRLKQTMLDSIINYKFFIYLSEKRL